MQLIDFHTLVSRLNVNTSSRQSFIVMLFCVVWYSPPKNTSIRLYKLQECPNRAVGAFPLGPSWVKNFHLKFSKNQKKIKTRKKWESFSFSPLYKQTPYPYLIPATNCRFKSLFRQRDNFFSHLQLMSMTTAHQASKNSTQTNTNRLNSFHWKLGHL